MQVITKIIQGKAYDGPYYRTEKGFVEVTQCNDCEMIGYYLDLRDGNPCPNCGGGVSRLSEPGIFREGRWELRTGFTKEDKPAVPEFYEKDKEEKIIKKDSFFSRFV